MFGFEENMSSGFHDVFLNKYTDSAVPIMDLYISDSMQDMLDIDIRTEVATVVGGPNEFSTLMNYYDLPSLDLDSTSNDGESNSLWFGGPKWPAINDVYADVGACVNPNSVMPVSVSSANVASLLKSPKVQLNLNNHINQHGGLLLPSPKERKSHLTFSPSTLKLSTNLVNSATESYKRLSGLAQSQRLNSVDSVKKDLSGDLKESKITSHLITSTSSGGITTPANVGVKSITSVGNNTTIAHDSSDSGGNTIHLAPGIGGLTFASQNVQFNKLKQNVKINNILQQNKRERSSSPHSNVISNNVSQQQSQQLNHNKFVQVRQQIGNRNIYNGTMYSSSSPSSNASSPAHHPHSPSTNHHSNFNGTPTTTKSNKSKLHGHGPLMHEFPKPAYSYSCLIAMALKNSRAGSLPVSEIYSFMCEHFPYFKTAPNGWKNSVRHNLSLNKCFEKIEKPATNGGQRKGCLWAMNPAKISKMDEEVQKWSRKDPMAIRKAMVHPEHLDALERGEMKHGRSGDSDVENNDNLSDIEDASDSEQEADVEENFINTPESLVEEESSEEEEPEVDYDIKLNDYLDDIEIDSDKNIDFYLYEEDIADGNSVLLNPKRARLDINYQITPAQNIMSSFTNAHSNYKQQLHQQQQNHNRRKTPLVNRIA